MAEDFRLPRTVRNDVFQLVETLGLNPAEFQWQEVAVSGYLWSQLVHRPTKYWFRFETWTSNRGASLGVSWRPASDTGSHSQTVPNLGAQLARCAVWLRAVKTEHESPDLWASVEAASRLMGAGPQAERDTGFSRAEIDMLRLRLDEIKAFLVERTSPSPSGVHHITVNINYLSDRAAHVSKLDWKNLLVGCLISIAVNLTVDRDAFRDMMGLAAQYFLPLLGMDLPLPLPPGS